MINWDKKATDLVNEYPYDERARLRDGITEALREAYEQGRQYERLRDIKPIEWKLARIIAHCGEVELTPPIRYILKIAQETPNASVRVGSTVCQHGAPTGTKCEWCPDTDKRRENG